MLETGDSPLVGLILIDFGDQTDPHHQFTYTSVITTRESIRLGFLVAALNNLQVLSADVAGAYLNAPCAKRVHMCNNMPTSSRTSA